MTPGQVLFIVTFGLPVACTSIILSLFVEKDKMLQATIVVLMVYFVIGFFGYMRMYAKSLNEEKMLPQSFTNR